MKSGSEWNLKGTLLLEDGSCFEGITIGAAGERIGEVVLNTAVVGYQEIMTDPANAGKIMVLTYPLIGNYGVAAKFNESRNSWIGALIIKEKSRIYSNWQAENSLDHFLHNEEVVAVSAMDTRTLAIKIRDQGEMLGIVSTKKAGPSLLQKKLEEFQRKPKRDWIQEVSVRRITRIKGRAQGPRMGILDLGITQSLLKQFKSLFGELILFPYNTPAEKIQSFRLDGLVVSNGPEGDAALPGVVKTVEKIIGRLPILGISTGHQVIALALGGKLKRLKVGHHGVNYPVHAPDSNSGEITVQNHSWVVDEESLRKRRDLRITLRNVNDATIEEMESAAQNFISTQYYPASPGFDEIHPALKRFAALIKPEKRS